MQPYTKTEQVLDHGYVEFIEAWGTGKAGQDTAFNTVWRDNECGIIEAARQSTQGSFRGWEGDLCDCGLDEPRQDEFGNPSVYVGRHPGHCASVKNPGDKRLLKYLHENNHATPFEFAGMVIEVQAPLFIFREWHRHRTQSYNEMSARYAPLPDLYYVPDRSRIVEGMGPQFNKQAKGLIDQVQDAGKVAELWLQRLGNFYGIAEAHYQNALADGIPKELARLVIPVGHYSRMRASANLRNWLAFMTLRDAPNAQWEIRQYAKAVGRVIEERFPQTWKLFVAARST